MDNPAEATGANSFTTIVWWILYPFGVVFRAIGTALVTIVKTLYRPIGFLLLPFFHFGRFLLAGLVLPFKVIAQLETVYIYLGVAALVGLVGGLLLRTIYHWLYDFLRLETETSSKGRTAKQYREQRRKQTKASDPTLLSPRHLSPRSMSPGYFSMSDGGRKGQRQRDLLAQTIMEEEDSEF